MQAYNGWYFLSSWFGFRSSRATIPAVFSPEKPPSVEMNCQRWHSCTQGTILHILQQALGFRTSHSKNHILFLLLLMVFLRKIIPKLILYIKMVRAVAWRRLSKSNNNNNLRIVLGSQVLRLWADSCETKLRKRKDANRRQFEFKYLRTYRGSDF